MTICVCIKQVPDVEAPIQIQDGELAFGSDRVVLNAYDASAVEEALVLTEEHGGEVDLVQVGSAGEMETVRKALAMGAARATHVATDTDSNLDSAAYARVLAAHLGEKEYDVIACGKQSQDTDAGLAGSMLAEHLGLPYATNAVGLEFDAERSVLVVTRQGDSGQEIIELPTPCLVTCSNDMNDPRIPKLRGIMQAKRKPVEEIDLDALGIEDLAPRTRVLGYEEKPAGEPVEMIDGETDEQVADLVSRLDNDANVL